MNVFFDNMAGIKNIKQKSCNEENRTNNYKDFFSIDKYPR